MISDRFRRRLCTRCGETPARPGHSTCDACTAVMLVKDSQRYARKRDRRKILARRLALLESAQATIRGELDRIAS